MGGLCLRFCAPGGRPEFRHLNLDVLCRHGVMRTRLLLAQSEDISRQQVQDRPHQGAMFQFQGSKIGCCIASSVRLHNIPELTVLSLLNTNPQAPKSETQPKSSNLKTADSPLRALGLGDPAHHCRDHGSEWSGQRCRTRTPSLSGHERSSERVPQQHLLSGLRWR